MSRRAGILLAGVVLAAASCGPTAEPAARSGGGEPPAAPFVVALGTVQDGGLPHAACTCARCEAARRDPSRRRSVASLAVVLPRAGRAYLVDATPDLRDQLHLLRRFHDGPAGRVDRAPVDGVFLTHAHIGHYLGLAYFGFEAIHTRGLAVWATPRMAAFLRGNGPWEQLVRLGEIELRPLALPAAGAVAGEPVELGEGVSIAAFPVPHRDEYSDTVAFLVHGPRRSLLYVPDTDGWERWRRPLPEVLRGVDTALLDGTFYSADELPGRAVSSIGHPLVTRTMDLLAPAVSAGRLRVWFTHLNHSNPALEPGSAAAREIERRGFGVLAEGQRFEI